MLALISALFGLVSGVSAQTPAKQQTENSESIIRSNAELAYVDAASCRALPC